MLRSPDVSLLHELLKGRNQENPPNVEDVAKRLGVSSAFVSTRLRKLLEEGWVERREIRTTTGRTVHYRPLAGLALQWVSPDEGVVLEWLSHGKVDWEFPLVSQVPDAPARLSIIAFLRALRDRRLLVPSTLEPDDPDSGSPKAFEHLGLTAVHHGSTARGSARAGADVDLIVFESEAQTVHVHPIVEDIAADVSLHAPRPLQVMVLKADEVESLPDRIERAVKTDGIVVHDGLKTGPAGSTRGIWRFVHGEREP